ncbi:MAG: ISKra4 family transposase, partial [Candidatus Electrothrix sp. LOE1_4_5]|nr:ISKra4 family transposase [Candidatus Electrothrix gigas]
MQPYDVEQSIVEGRQELNQLFDTIVRNALSMDSYEAESFIFSEIMKVGHAAMKVYFASVGTGDVGKNMQTSDGSLYSREASLRGRNYFSVFGKLKVPRTCYRKKGLPG